MKNPQLAGIRAKIDRAHDHLQQLHAAIDAWGSSKEHPEDLVVYHDPQRKQLRFAHGPARANDPKWALIIGDVVHNLRSALDHLVCQLAVANGNSIQCCESTFFPICICRSDFRRAHQRIEPLLDPAAFAEIENLQPYKAAHAQGIDPARSNLWIIHKLDIIDKHRTLLVAAQFFRVTDFSYSVNQGTSVSLPIGDLWRPLKDDAEIAKIDLPPSFAGEDKMRVQAGTEVKVLFNETGCGCDGLEVGEALLPCIQYVTEIVDFFELKFF